MKKIIAVAKPLAVLGASMQTAKAGDRERATIGKVMTGVAAVSLVANAIDHHRSG